MLLLVTPVKLSGAGEIRCGILEQQLSKSLLFMGPKPLFAFP